MFRKLGGNFWKSFEAFRVMEGAGGGGRFQPNGICSSAKDFDVKFEAGEAGEDIFEFVAGRG
jgi:hypothetical protein